MLHLMSQLAGLVLLANATVVVILLAAWLRSDALRHREAGAAGRRS
jgi:hypothetical protein